MFAKSMRRKRETGPPEPGAAVESTNLGHLGRAAAAPFTAVLVVRGGASKFHCFTESGLKVFCGPDGFVLCW